MEVDGIVVTTPLRTTTDLLRKLWRPYALAAADGMAHAGLVEVPEVVEAVGRLKGFPGIVQARSLAHLIEPLAQSAGESWQRLRLLDAGFPRPTAQHPVRMPDGSFRYLDLAYPHLLVASEYDGREFHTMAADAEHDELRRALLSRLWGWRWANGDRESIFGTDPAFELRIGELIGIEPEPRYW